MNNCASPCVTHTPQYDISNIILSLSVVHINTTVVCRRTRVRRIVIQAQPQHGTTHTNKNTVLLDQNGPYQHKIMNKHNQTTEWIYIQNDTNALSCREVPGSFADTLDVGNIKVKTETRISKHKSENQFLHYHSNGRPHAVTPSLRLTRRKGPARCVAHGSQDTRESRDSKTLIGINYPLPRPPVPPAGNQWPENSLA